MLTLGLRHNVATGVSSQNFNGRLERKYSRFFVMPAEIPLRRLQHVAPRRADGKSGVDLPHMRISLREIAQLRIVAGREMFGQ